MLKDNVTDGEVHQTQKCTTNYLAFWDSVHDLILQGTTTSLLLFEDRIAGIAQIGNYVNKYLLILAI
jgi:hypothetical protein